MWCHKHLFYFFLLETITKKSYSARILVVLPTPSFSHNLIYRTIYKELALRGHDLVVFTPDPLRDENLKNLKEIDLSHFYSLTSHAKFEKLFYFFRIAVVYAFQKTLSGLVDKTFDHEEMQKLLKNPNENFDLVMIEWNVNPSLAVLSKRFNCPLIGLRSCGLRLEGHDSLGNPTNPSYIPIAYMDFERNFWGRLDNFLFGLIWRLHHHFITVPQAQKIANKYFPNISNGVLEIERNVSVVITNTNPILTGIRPMVPAIIEVGGIHLGKELKEIPKDIKNFLDQGNRGVIYLSLGTNINTTKIAPNIVKIIIKTLSSIPFDVIWKWKMEKSIQLPTNVKVWKWVPQEAILGSGPTKLPTSFKKLFIAHSNIKLFITHGGLQSIEESIDSLVPMVGIPFFADQFFNTKRIEELGIGKGLNLLNLTQKEFVETILEVSTDVNYRQKIKLIKQIFHDQPIKPLEKAVWWIEHVIRHKGTKYLKYPGADMNWIEYLMIDVQLIIAITLISICLSIYLIYQLMMTLIKIIVIKKSKLKSN